MNLRTDIDLQNRLKLFNVLSVLILPSSAYSIQIGYYQSDPELLLWPIDDPDIPRETHHSLYADDVYEL